MNRPIRTTTSREIIENLSSELDKLYLRSQMPKSSSDLYLQDDEAECDYFNDLEERLTGKKGMKRPQCLGDSIPSGPSRPYDEYPIETPASPSAAGIVLPSNGSSRSRHSSGTVTGDGHQLYFDAETGEDMSTRHHADGSSSRKGLVKDDSSGISSSGNSETVHPTHRATHRFVKRHEDEISMEVGDPIYVEEEAEDLWCIGVNLRSGARGVFPIVYVFEIDFEEECGPISSLRLNTQEKATFYLTFLGSVEVAYHKGNDVLVQAINKVLHFYQSKEETVVPLSVLLDVSFRGIHVIDKSKKTWFQCPNFDYFYTLQNVSFCGAHPKQLRYFGFISKHPLLPRFACNVFLSNTSTQQIVDSIGRAFQRSYDEYMAFAHPTDDIFLE